jgi:hypothetical protein
VSGRLEEACDVDDEIEGPGVDTGDDGKGGGVTDTDRCIDAIWIAGLARQNDDAVGTDCATGALALIPLTPLAPGAGVRLDLTIDEARFPLSSRAAAAFILFLSLSRSRLSFFLSLLLFSSVSTNWLMGTPLRTLVRT